MSSTAELGVLSTSSSLASVPGDPLNGKRAEDMIRECRRKVEGWSGLPKESFHLDTISGGMTNQLFKCSTSYPDVEKRSALVRIFGVETALCRNKDNAIFRQMSKAGLGPELYGVFDGGRIEEFLENARPLTNEEMKQPANSKRIARSLAMVHELTVPNLEKGVPELLSNVRNTVKNLNDVGLSTLPNSTDYYLSRVDEIVKKTNSPVLFCHNDLQEGNIMLENNTGELTLIDFEYGGYNYSLFDIGNHFAEYAFEYTDDPAGDLAFELLKDAYPSRTQMLDFLGEYSSVLQSGSEPEDVMLDTQRFILASHLYWGLWAAGCSSKGPGYVSYSQTRLSEFERMAETLL